jgi:hypothetical protein
MAKGRAPKHRGRNSAKKLLELLDGDQFRAAVRFSSDEVATIRRICTGRYVRNAAAIMNAFRMRAEYAYAKPAQGLDIVITEDREDPTDEEWAELTALRHKVRGEGGDPDAT